MKLTLILCALALVTVANAANLRTEAPAKKQPATKQPAQKPAPGGAQKPAAPVAAVDPCAQYSMMGSATCGSKADTQCNEFEFGHAAAMDHCIKAPQGCKWTGDPHWDKADTNKPVHVYHEDPYKNDADKEKGFKWQELLNKQVCIKATEMERIKSTPMMNIKGARKARAGAKPAQPAAPVADVETCEQHSMSYSKACKDDESCLTGDDKNKKKDCAAAGCEWKECKGPKYKKCAKGKTSVFGVFTEDVSWCEAKPAVKPAGKAPPKPAGTAPTKPAGTAPPKQAGKKAVTPPAEHPVQPDGVDGPGY